MLETEKFSGVVELRSSGQNVFKPRDKTGDASFMTEVCT
jgi:hypothetical protein